MKNQTQRKPTAAKFSLLRQLCNLIPNHLVPQLAREHPALYPDPRHAVATPRLAPTPRPLWGSRWRWPLPRHTATGLFARPHLILWDSRYSYHRLNYQILNLILSPRFRFFRKTIPFTQCPCLGGTTENKFHSILRCSRDGLPFRSWKVRPFTDEFEFFDRAYAHSTYTNEMARRKRPRIFGGRPG
jgi:hypothetical protein